MLYLYLYHKTVLGKTKWLPVMAVYILNALLVFASFTVVFFSVPANIPLQYAQIAPILGGMAAFSIAMQLYQFSTGKGFPAEIRRCQKAKRISTAIVVLGLLLFSAFILTVAYLFLDRSSILPLSCLQGCFMVFIPGERILGRKALKKFETDYPEILQAALEETPEKA